MNKNWIGMTTEMSGAVREVRSGAPDVMKAFSALAQAALKAGAPQYQDQGANCTRDFGGDALRCLRRVPRRSSRQAGRQP